MRGDVVKERRRASWSARDPYRDPYLDRRQPFGVVASLVRVAGGELCRSRVHHVHLAAVLRARYARDAAAFARDLLGIEGQPWQAALMRTLETGVRPRLLRDPGKSLVHAASYRRVLPGHFTWRERARCWWRRTWQRVGTLTWSDAPLRTVGRFRRLVP